MLVFKTVLPLMSITLTDVPSIPFKEKLIHVIKEEFPEEKKNYFKNANNLSKMADDVHKLKHKISILGLKESYKIAEDFEKNLREESTLLKDDFEKILETISDFLNTI